MERRVAVALALTLPLALYGIPYAYAVSAQTTYVVDSGPTNIAAGGYGQFTLKCSGPLDSTLHWTYLQMDLNIVHFAYPANSAGSPAHTGDNPNGWFIGLHNPTNSPDSDEV